MLTGAAAASASEAEMTAAVIFEKVFIIISPFVKNILQERPPKRPVCYFLSFKYLGSVGAYAYHAYMAADKLLETCDVALAVGRELIEVCAL